MNQFAIIVGGIALLVIGGGALIARERLIGLYCIVGASIVAALDRPLKKGGDEYTDLNSIGGGDGFHHPHAITQNGGQDRAGQ